LTGAFGTQTLRLKSQTFGSYPCIHCTYVCICMAGPWRCCCLASLRSTFVTCTRQNPRRQHRNKSTSNSFLGDPIRIFCACTNTMKSFLRFCLFVVIVVASSTSAFMATPTRGGAVGGSSFVVSTKASSIAPRTHHRSSSSLQMGSQAKFGVFSPAVYAAKVVLGGDKLNKIRGKAISLHSQYIGDFCQWVGAYHLRTQLVKKAKTNGDILGFLV
jgi:hypothetical protein